jgi:hypothetical protein
MKISIVGLCLFREFINYIIENLMQLILQCSSKTYDVSFFVSIPIELQSKLQRSVRRPLPYVILCPDKMTFELELTTDIEGLLRTDIIRP